MAPNIALEHGKIRSFSLYDFGSSEFPGSMLSPFVRSHGKPLVWRFDLPTCPGSTRTLWLGVPGSRCPIALPQDPGIGVGESASGECPGTFLGTPAAPKLARDDQTRSAAITRGIPARSLVMLILAQRRSASNILRTASAEL